ncbi:hypothetical protein AVEN_69554-1 [Araneus ventricosus]|uniref:Uncharacterized protein n=1 Tax=Araneus ventricosus TaxID=182803 RepID=A0A4Y2TE52_ARAVE|nr:hypothetical protein AVEN_69554-1 [Araneus ventricosus]
MRTQRPAAATENRARSRPQNSPRYERLMRQPVFGRRPFSEVGPTSHTIIIVPTSESGNPFTYPAASDPRTRGAPQWDSKTRDILGLTS